MRTLNLKLKCLFSHSLGLQLESKSAPSSHTGVFFREGGGQERTSAELSWPEMAPSGSGGCWNWLSGGLGDLQNSQWAWEIFKTLSGPWGSSKLSMGLGDLQNSQWAWGIFRTLNGPGRSSELSLAMHLWILWRHCVAGKFSSEVL